MNWKIIWSVLTVLAKQSKWQEWFRSTNVFILVCVFKFSSMTWATLMVFVSMEHNIYGFVFETNHCLRWDWETQPDIENSMKYRNAKFQNNCWSCGDHGKIYCSRWLIVLLHIFKLSIWFCTLLQTDKKYVRIRSLYHLGQTQLLVSQKSD